MCDKTNFLKMNIFLLLMWSSIYTQNLSDLYEINKQLNIRLINLNDSAKIISVKIDSLENVQAIAKLENTNNKIYYAEIISKYAIRKVPELSTNDLILIKPKTKIIVNGFVNGFVEILYKGEKAYVSKDLLVLDDETKDYINNLDKSQNPPKPKDKKLLALIKRFGELYGTRVYDKQIWIGMTESMLMEVKGEPDRIAHTKSQYTDRKVYWYSYSYYSFESGKLKMYRE